MLCSYLWSLKRIKLMRFSSCTVFWLIIHKSHSRGIWNWQQRHQVMKRLFKNVKRRCRNSINSLEKSKNSWVVRTRGCFRRYPMIYWSISPRVLGLLILDSFKSSSWSEVALKEMPKLSRKYSKRTKRLYKTQQTKSSSSRGETMKTLIFDGGLLLWNNSKDPRDLMLIDE